MNLFSELDDVFNYEPKRWIQIQFTNTLMAFISILPCDHVHWASSVFALKSLHLSAIFCQTVVSPSPCVILCYFNSLCLHIPLPVRNWIQLHAHMLPSASRCLTFWAKNVKYPSLIWADKHLINALLWSMKLVQVDEKNELLVFLSFAWYNRCITMRCMLFLLNRSIRYFVIQSY